MRSLANQIAIAAMLFFLSLAGVQSAHAERTVHEGKVHESEGIPFRQDSVIPPATLSRVMWVVLLAIAFAVVIIFALKKYLYATGFKAESGRRINLIEAKRLSPRLSLFLVQIEAKHVLISQSGDTIAVLKLDEESPPARIETEHE